MSAECPECHQSIKEAARTIIELDSYRQDVDVIQYDVHLLCYTKLHEELVKRLEIK